MGYDTHRRFLALLTDAQIFVDEPEKARPKPCARVDEKAGGLEPDTAFTAKALHAHGYTTIFVSGFMPDEVGSLVF